MCRESDQADEVPPTTQYGIKVWKYGHCSQSDLIDRSDVTGISADVSSHQTSHVLHA